MPVNVRAVSNAEDLLKRLAAIDISVPARIDGRTTDHTETWTIARLLATLASTDDTLFPLTVVHRDRPDIELQRHASAIGIEITEAVSEEYAAYSALAEREFPDVFLQPGHFRWGAPRKTLEEMRKLLREAQMSSKPWVGDSAEREWALFMQSIVETKQSKLARDDFSKFDLNWLAIYDNLPLPNVDVGKAIAVLQPLLRTHWEAAPHFDSVFIEHGPIIVRITERASDHLVLNDLWD